VNGACAKAKTSHHERAMIRPLLFVPLVLFMLGGCGDDDKPGPVLHPVSSRSDATCLSCHETGVVGAPEMEHGARARCVSCHTVTQSVVAPAIPHEVTSDRADDCRSCHTSGSTGAPVTDHPDWPECINCHM
jgi:hypothetical protein